jgi:methylmalonyl-CoA/ethylmalonyl-CoA epimerase
MKTNLIFNDFVFHHIGMLVRDMDEAVKSYETLFGSENISYIYTLQSQNVKECFIKNGENTYIGLVSPIGKESVINNLLQKGISYYHLAYKVKDLQSSITRLEELYYKSLSPFSSEAFNGNKCVFLFTPEGHLIELIEDKKHK